MSFEKSKNSLNDLQNDFTGSFKKIGSDIQNDFKKVGFEIPDNILSTGKTLKNGNNR